MEGGGGVLPWPVDALELCREACRARSKAVSLCVDVGDFVVEAGGWQAGVCCDAATVCLVLPDGFRASTLNPPRLVVALRAASVDDSAHGAGRWSVGCQVKMKSEAVFSKSVE